MALVIEESWLPATITHPPMSDEEFAEFCSEHSDLSFEMTADGEILIMPPPYTLTGVRCSEISYQLESWNRRGRTGVCGEATGGFVLPSGARRSPDTTRRWHPAGSGATRQHHDDHDLSNHPMRTSNHPIMTTP